jgi:fructuronate reductase
MADVLRSAVAGADGPEKVVDALLSITDVFGSDLRDSEVFRDLLTDHLGRLMSGTGPGGDCVF